MARDKKETLLSIQYLRAVAALAVAYFHIGEIFGYRLNFGAAGVDIFFVISGFVMWMVSRDREAKPAAFLAKRAIRIVPLYWLATILLAFGALWHPTLFPLDHPTLRHIALSLAFIPHSMPNERPGPLLSQGWTLNYEAFFYLVFAGVLFVPKRRQLLALFCLLGFSVVAGLLFRPQDTLLQAYTSPLLLEFLAGVFICHFWIRGRLPGAWAGTTAIVFGAGAILCSYYCQLALPRVVSYGLPAAMIVTGSLTLERHGMVRSWAFMKMLGDASYSIYLTHFLCWAAMSVIGDKLHLQLSLGFYLACIAMATAVGIAMHLFVEKPMARKLQHWLSVLPAKAYRIKSAGLAFLAEGKHLASQTVRQLRYLTGAFL